MNVSTSGKKTAADTNFRCGLRCGLQSPIHALACRLGTKAYTAHGLLPRAPNGRRPRGYPPTKPQRSICSMHPEARHSLLLFRRPWARPALPKYATLHTIEMYGAYISIVCNVARGGKQKPRQACTSLAGLAGVYRTLSSLPQISSVSIRFQNRYGLVMSVHLSLAARMRGASVYGLTEMARSLAQIRRMSSQRCWGCTCDDDVAELGQ